jgi:acylglycerol lipase
VPHTAYDDADPALFLGPRGAQSTMVNRKGLRLKALFWPAQDAKAVLVFVHGHGAHLMFELLRGRGLGAVPGYEGSWAQRLNAAGISVCGVDNQGCGRSQGARGLRFYVESFDDYVDDVLQLADALDGAAPAPDGGAPPPEEAFSVPPGFARLPRFVSGISLGGCIAFGAATRRRGLFRGAALLAPMLSLERVSRQGLNPYMRPVAALLSRLVPTAAVVATDRNVLYPEIQALWDADPLAAHGKTRVRNANEYLRATEAAMARLEEVDFPFLAFHSEVDTMCDPAGSKALFLRARSADKALRLVNHMWHVLVKEAGNEKICDEIAAWVVARAQA